MSGTIDTLPINEQIQAIYIGYFGRAADADGLAYWSQEMATLLADGYSDDSALVLIANQFAVQAETVALYPFLAGNPPASSLSTANLDTLITSIYQNLFSLPPDPTGEAYWVNQLQTGKLTLGNIILAISNGATGIDATILLDKIQVATYFTTATGAIGVDGGAAFSAEAAAVVAFVGSLGTTATDLANSITYAELAINQFVASPSLGTTFFQPSAIFTLTTGTDIVTGGYTEVIGNLTSFSYSGVGPTVNSTDVIEFTAANPLPLLYITDSWGQGIDLLPAGITLSDITTIQLVTAGNAGSNIDQPFSTVSPTISGIGNVIVTSSGSGYDWVQAGSSTTITITHNNVSGAVWTNGGSNVTVTSNGDGDGYYYSPIDVYLNVGVVVGSAYYPGYDSFTPGLVPTGAVSVTETGYGSVYIYGGTSVSGVDNGNAVTVNVTNKTPTDTSDGYGLIQIGNTPINTGDFGTDGAANPTGPIVVTDDSPFSGYDDGYAAITIFGGTTVTVTAAGDAIQIGDLYDVLASNQPTGNVTVTNTAPLVYDDIINILEEDVVVAGGANVSVTTNAGGVYIGDLYGGYPGDNPTGTVTVVDTATGFYTDDFEEEYIGTYDGIKYDEDFYFGQPWDHSPVSVSVYGGTGVTVAAASGTILIGDGSTVDDPTGAVSVTEATGTFTVNGASVTLNAVNTGPEYGNQIVVAGAGAGDAVTILTSGVGNGDHLYYGNGDGIQVGTLTSPVSGAVTITDTFSGRQHDDISVLGGTTVTIEQNYSNHDEISVGALPLLQGSTLANGALDPNNTVTIVDETVQYTAAGTATGTIFYGDESFAIVTDGSTSVSVTGGAGHDNYIIDAMSTLYSGQPVGTSKLNSVTLDGVNGENYIQTDALATLNIENADWERTVIADDTMGYTLALNLTDANARVIDGDQFYGDQTGLGYIGDLVVTAVSGESELWLYAPEATAFGVTVDAGATLLIDGGINLSDVNTAVTFTVDGTLTINPGDNFSSVPSVTFNLGSGATATINADNVSAATKGTFSLASGATMNVEGTDFAALKTMTITEAAGADMVVAGATLTALQSITVTGPSGGSAGGGTATLNLGDLTTEAGTALTSVSISGNVNVTAEINGLQTSFVETGSGSVWLTLDDGIGMSGGHAIDINAGTGTDNTLVLTDPASDYIVGLSQAISTYALGFQTLLVEGNADGTYDATGFSAVGIYGATAGPITFTNVDPAPTAYLELWANPGHTVTVVPASGTANTLEIDLYTTGTNTVDIGGAVALVPVGFSTLNIVNDNYLGNTLTVHDDTFAIVSPLTTINIDDVNGDLTLDATSLGFGSVSAINVTGDSGYLVDVLGVANTSATGVIFTVASGSYQLVYAEGTQSALEVDTANDVFNGDGYGSNVYTIGFGGAGGYGGSLTTLVNPDGSETINLASGGDAYTSTLVVNEALHVFANYEGIAATVNNFVATDSYYADTIAYATKKTEYANTSSAVAAASGDTYNASNGVLTYTGNGGAISLTQELADVEYLVNAKGANEVAMFEYAGDTWVVASNDAHVGDLSDSVLDLTNVTGTEIAFSYVANAAGDTVDTNPFDLATDLYYTEALNTYLQGANGAVMLEDVELAYKAFTFSSSGGSDSASGYAVAYLAGAASATAITATTTISGLGPSGELFIANTSSSGYWGNIAVSQSGTGDALVISLEDSAHTGSLGTIGTLTVSNDISLGIWNGSGTNTITSLVDATNSMDNLILAGGGDLTIGGITSKVLGYIDATEFSGELTLTAPSNTNLELWAQDTEWAVITANGNGNDIYVTSDSYFTDSFTFAGYSWSGQEIGAIVTANGSTTANSDTETITVYAEYGVIVTANGATDTINVYSNDDVWIAAGGSNDTINVTSDPADVYIQANGGTDTISVSSADAAYIGAPGANDVITLDGVDGGWLAGNVTDDFGHATGTLGAGDKIYLTDASAHMWAGPNDTINLSDGSFADVHLLGDTAGSNAGSTSALPNMVVITGVDTDHDSLRLHFNDETPTGSTGIWEAWAGGYAADSQVNVSGAATLAVALNIAAAQALVLDQQFDGGLNTSVTLYNEPAGKLELNAHTALVDWFQYQGNTYIVEAVNPTGNDLTHSALQSQDIVVELTGLVDVSHVSVHLA